MDCTGCGTANREIAKYCKHCGTALSEAELSGETSSPFESLAGLDEIKGELKEIDRVLRGMRKDNSFVRMNYSAILIGNSGTAKSLIGNLFFRVLKTHEVITRDQPEFLNSTDFQAMDFQGVEKLFKKNLGGMIILDNIQDLLDTQGAKANMKKLINEMDRHKNDPVIILSGLPYGPREFLKDDKNAYFTGRFRNIFYIDDYDSETLKAIVEQELFQHFSMTATDAFSEKLIKRCRYLAREMKDPQTQLDALNGYLAISEASEIVNAYYLRGGKKKQLLPEDILGKVEEPKSIDEILEKLNNFVGMKSIKKSIRELHQRLEVKKRQVRETEDSSRSSGSRKSPETLHSVITGNPGTGKTTVVRILGEIYGALGVLDTGHVIEVDRSKLVAGYKGQTAIQVNRVCDKAMGGVLFVDEAYALKQGDSDDFGQEAIDTLMKRVEDDREKFACILAGYKTEMQELLKSNPGLNSRFPLRFHLEDYNAEELLEIFTIIASSSGYTLTDGAVKKSAVHFKDITARKTKNFANGRESRNFFEKAKNLHSQRLSELLTQGGVKQDEYTLIREEDIPLPGAEKTVTTEEALERLHSLIGLESVKKKVSDLINSLEVQKMRGEQKPINAHFVFRGNPGTGKTTVARILSDVFYAIGLLPTNNLVEADRSTMVSGYANQTAGQVQDLCDMAMGGVLFIDEAYALKQGDNDSAGQQAIETLLKRMEDDNGKFVAIAAGYTREMDAFISSNSGLDSRFNFQIDFEDYSAREMTEIYKIFASKEAFTLEEGLEDELLTLFRGIESRKTKNFGNARTVRRTFESTRERLSRRIINLKNSGSDEKTLKQEVNIIRREDLPGREA